jgi:hypothetical protein
MEICFCLSVCIVCCGATIQSVQFTVVQVQVLECKVFAEFLISGAILYQNVLTKNITNFVKQLSN